MPFLCCCRSPAASPLLPRLLQRVVIIAAKSVTACDFMAVSIEENRRKHEALGNVDFIVADVTELQQVRGRARQQLERGV